MNEQEVKDAKRLLIWISLLAAIIFAGSVLVGSFLLNRRGVSQVDIVRKADQAREKLRTAQIKNLQSQMEALRELRVVMDVYSESVSNKLRSELEKQK